MSNEVNNLASSFVAMAQAFEKLPLVQAELDTAHTQIEEYAKHVQRLEMRLMDAKEELDNAHAATRKMEVERDHAETMFLETDDKLAKAKDVLKVLIGDAGDFLRVVEPPKPEPVIEQPVVTLQESKKEWNEDGWGEPVSTSTPVQGQSEPSPISDPIAASGIGMETATHATETAEAPQPADPTTAPSWATSTSSPSIASETSAVSGESVASSSTEGVSVQRDPTPGMGSSSGSDLSGLTENAQLLKPYEGKRYTEVPFYVSLVEWLNGGGTEEAYYAR